MRVKADDRLAEQETVLRWDQLTNEAVLYTADERLSKRLIRKGLAPKKTHKDSAGDDTGWDFSLNKGDFSMDAGRGKVRLSPVRRTREKRSDEQEIQSQQA